MRLSLFFLFSALACYGAPGKPFTIADVMSASFASELVASPAAARVAWVEYRQGRRNVWVAAAPDWSGVPVTHFGEDDGQEISGLTWDAAGAALLFVRGGDAENGGENPNPGPLPVVPSQDIWRLSLNLKSLSLSKAVKLAEGHSPESAIGGIAFLRGSAIYTMGANGEAPAAAVRDKGIVSSLTWSPQADSLAFVSKRAGHSFIGIYSIAGKTLRYLDASSDQDMFPSWSPDGTSIAYVRVPVGVGDLPGPHREDVAWSIRVTQLNTGETREVFRAAAHAGSVFHPIESSRQLFWTKDGQIIFPWERTGWCHLYSIGVAAVASQAADLTPGEGEVEFASSTPAGSIFYSANIGDPDARHLWQLDGQTHQLTTMKGVQTAPVSVAGSSAVAFLASSYQSPAHAAVCLPSGVVKDLQADAFPAEFPAKEFVQPQAVLLSAADGMILHAQLFLPPDNGKKHPALVFFHGGSRRQMLPAFHYMFYYSNAYAMNQYFASQGYVVLAVNYRSGIGYGLDFREAPRYGVAGASEYNDVMGAGLYLRSRADVDGKRIGSWGGSYGGYLTALALARSSDLFAAGVDFHGVHDWSSLRGYNLEDAGGDAARLAARQQLARTAFESSPLASMAGWRSPVLLIHGDDDRNVDFPQTEQLVKALRQQPVDFEELVFANEIHDFLLHRSWVSAYTASAHFLQRKLAAQ